MPKNHLVGTQRCVSIAFRRRGLLWELTTREHRDRYSGQILGLWWSVAHPLFLIALYVFIFNIVFRLDTLATENLPRDYTTYLLSGLIPWMSLQETLSKSCTAITAKVEAVKQAAFPIEILPLRVVLAAHQTMLISLVCMTIYQVVKFQNLPITYLGLLVLIPTQILLSAGLGYALASIGTYLRDVKDMIQIISTGGIYLLPIFYLPAWVPDLFQPILAVNPFSHLVWCYQDLLFYGAIRHPASWVFIFLFTTLTFICGCELFQKLRPGFGNVL